MATTKFKVLYNMTQINERHSLLEKQLIFQSFKNRYMRRA